MRILIENNILREFQNLKKEAVNASENAKAVQNDDEANFYKIQWNIVDIFEKMYHASINQIKDQSNSEDILWLEAFEKQYLAYFNKIPSSWVVNLEKCEKHGLFSEAHIEKVKIEMAKKMETFVKKVIETQREELSRGRV